MATITRNNLVKAIEDADSAFVSKEAKHRLLGWAYDAKEFTVGDWDKCPLDQIGLVEKFTKRARYSQFEDLRFTNEASELDAQILKHVNTELVGDVNGLLVTVVDAPGARAYA